MKSKPLIFSRSTVRFASRWFWSILLLAAGTAHFIRNDFFIAYYPDFLPWPEQVVFVSGLFELLLAIAIWHACWVRLIWMLIATLMILYLPVHRYVIVAHDMINHPRPAIPLWLAWIRFPIQFLLIAWPLGLAFRFMLTASI